MNFFVHGCLIGTAETSSNLALDFTDNPIIPIQLSWLPRQSVENIVRSDFPNGLELLKSDFFLRILTLAGGNARLLECLRQGLNSETQSTSIDILQKDLLSNWISVVKVRFSVNINQWSTSTTKMALLLAMTGIPVEMNTELSSEEIDSTGKHKYDSLKFVDLENNGVIQRRALPPNTKFNQKYYPNNQYVLQLSPLVAYLIMGEINSCMIRISFSVCLTFLSFYSSQTAHGRGCSHSRIEKGIEGC